MPMTVTLGFCFFGLFLLWFTRKQKTGKAMVTGGLILLTVFSYGVVSAPLLKEIERKYPVYTPRSEDVGRISHVVVLGAGHVSEAALPLTGQIHSQALVRLIEGIRLYRELPGSKLILSGGIGFDPVPNAEILQGIALQIGVSPEDIIIEDQSKDTKDEAKFLKPVLGETPFILVTSAYHMPRAMGLFKNLGMDPIPAPTGHGVRERRGGLYPSMFFPDPGGLATTERIMKESLGTLWARLRGQF